MKRKVLSFLGAGFICACAVSMMASVPPKKISPRQLSDLPPAIRQDIKELKFERLRENKVHQVALPPKGKRPQLVTLAPATDAGPLNDVSGNTWSKLFAPKGAEVFGLAPDPYVPNRVFAMTWGGLYLSVDDGRTWRLIPYLQGWNLMAIAGFVKGSPNVIFLGCQDGLWRSTDGGNTWAPFNPSQIHLGVSAVAISPDDPNRMLVAMTDWSSDPDQGVWLSTNGGASFAKVTDIGNTWANNNCLVFAPSNPQTVWLTGWDNIIYDPTPPAVPPPAVFKSTDGGAHWSVVPITFMSGNADVVSLYVNPADPNDAMFLNLWDSMAYRYNGLGQFIVDGGSQETTAFAVDGANFEKAYKASGLNYWQLVRDYATKEWLFDITDPSTGIAVSANGGMDWSNMGGPSIGKDDNALLSYVAALAVTGNGTILVGTTDNQGGIWRYDPANREWADSSNGMIHRVVGVSVNGANPNEAWAAVARPGLFHTTDGGAYWEWLRPADPLNRDTLPILHHHGSSTEYAYYYGPQAQYLTGAIATTPLLTVGTLYGTAISASGGVPFTFLTNPDYGGAGDPPGRGYLGVFSLRYEQAACTTPPNSLLEGRSWSLYRTCDGTVARIGPANMTVRQIWEDPSNAPHILIGTNAGVQETVDGGTTWTTKTSALTETRVDSLLVDPDNSAHWMAGMLNPATGAGDLYQTSDSGATWTPAGLWSDFTTLAVVPGAAGNFWAGATYPPAAFRSSDGGASWTTDWAAGPGECGAGLSSMAVGASSPLDPWAGTYGGGVFRKQTAPPSKPTGVVVSDQGDGLNVQVSWNANPEGDIAGYRIIGNAYGQPLTQTPDGGFVTGTSLAFDANDIPYSPIDIAVIAVNTAGEVSPQSDIATGMATCGAPPPAPAANVSPAQGAVGVSTLPTLSWTPVPGATRYRVQVATDPEFAGLVIDVADLLSAQYQVGDAASGAILNNIWTSALECANGSNPANPSYFTRGQYWWRVYPGDACGYGQVPSAAFSFMTTPEDAPAGIPQLLQPANGATGLSGSVTLQWGAVSGVSMYEVQVATDEEFSDIILDILTPEASLRAVVPYCSTVYWRVYAGLTCQMGEIPSTVWHFSTSDSTPSGVPTLVMPANGAANQPTSLYLQWNAVPGVGDYQYQVALDSAFTSIVYDNVTPDTQALVDGLNPSTPYYWRVAKRAPATSLELSSPTDLVTDGHDYVYVASYGTNMVYRMDIPNNTVTTVAGNGDWSYDGDSGLATDATFYGIMGLSRSPSGDLYIADTGNSVIRKVDHATNIITTVAGNGSYDYSGDGGPATEAALNQPFKIAFDGAGNLYIADTGNFVIRKVDHATGIITTVAGNGDYGTYGDGGPATEAGMTVAFAVTADASGNLWIGTQDTVRYVDAATGTISTVAGAAMQQGFSGDGGPATSALLYAAIAVTADADGNFWFSDWGNYRIRRVTKATGTITTVAGNGSQGYSGDGGPAPQAEINEPYGVCLSPFGGFYIADMSNDVAREVDHRGYISTVQAFTGVSQECSTGSFSEPFSFTTTDQDCQAAPALINPPNGTAGVSIAPMMTWLGTSGSYHIQIASDSSFATIVEEQTGVGQPNYTPSNLGAGIQYFWRVAGEAATCGDSSWSGTSSFTTTNNDTTPPTTPVVTIPSPYTSSATSLSASWLASDPESGISRYETAIGTAPTLMDVQGWTNQGAATNAVFGGLPLQQGKTYYILCRATNGNSMVSAVGVSAGITVDTTRPGVPAVTDDGSMTYNLTQLHATFAASDDVSGIAAYMYCIGTYAGGQDVKGWTVIAAGEATATGLTLIPGASYFFTARAENGAGLWSSQGYSDGILAALAPPPVPDGSFGTAATFTRTAQDGTSLHVSWDTATCTASGYSIYYGDLANVSSVALSGSQCGIGTSGSYDWTSNVPPGNVFFIIVANDGMTTEGSWGSDYIGGVHHERGGTAASGQCGIANRVNGGTCP